LKGTPRNKARTACPAPWNATAKSERLVFLSWHLEVNRTILIFSRQRLYLSG
jgi:hypothetical protein